MTRVRRFTLLFVFGSFSESEILSNNLPLNLSLVYSYEYKSEYEIPSKIMHLNPFVTHFLNVKLNNKSNYCHAQLVNFLNLKLNVNSIKKLPLNSCLASFLNLKLSEIQLKS